MVNYVTGNLFQVKSGVIAHGVNCKGGFGSGIAGQIAKLYPKARKLYFDKYHKEGWKLGDVQLVLINGLNYGEDLLIIANCATQYDYGTHKIQADYQAIKSCLTQLSAISKDFNVPIHMPRIGAGLAGGDWEKIKSLIEEIGAEADITVYSL